MSDPTPEESGKPFYHDWRHCLEHPGVLLQGAQVCFICTEIRAAVEAEREHWQSKYTASQEALTEILTEHRKLCFVAESVIDCASCPDCSEIAREALGRTPSEEGTNED